MTTGLKKPYQLRKARRASLGKANAIANYIPRLRKSLSIVAANKLRNSLPSWLRNDMLRRSKFMTDRTASNEAALSRTAGDHATVPEDRWIRIITVAFIMYTIAYIDRTNVSLALPLMSRDLHMDPTHAGDAVGVFFWGYMVLQIPGGYLAQHSSAKKFVSLLLVFWGVCSAATGFVRTGREFWWMRLALGVAEGGVWPAVLVLLSHWFPRAERARANAYWMLCMPVALILSSPLPACLGRASVPVPARSPAGRRN